MPRCVVGKALYEASLQGHWEIVQLLAEAKDGAMVLFPQETKVYPITESLKMG